MANAHDAVEEIKVEEQDLRDSILSRSGPAKQEFIEYLETGLLERDFRNLF